MHFIAFILKNLTRRPTRTVLTVLGLAVAAGSMIALLGISANFESAATDAFERRGVDLVVVPGGQTDQLSGRIDEKVVEQIRSWKEVKWVDAAIIDMAEMWSRDPRPGETSAPSRSVMVHAWSPENFEHEEMEIEAGRRLRRGETRTVMLGQRLASDLDKGVGSTVTILGSPYEVAGVFKSPTVFENGGVVMQLADYQREVGAEGKVTGLSLAVRERGDGAADVEAVRQRVQSLTDDAGKPLRLSAEPPETYAAQASHLRLTRAMAWVVSVVALLIGVIGMLNTMAMSVLERTQEIGILRAVGWPRARVMRMVLGEAVFLGFLAAAVGAAGAVATTYALSHVPGVNGFIEGGIAPRVILEGLAITAVIGLVGGAFPALRAARLLPTEAIRHD